MRVVSADGGTVFELVAIKGSPCFGTTKVSIGCVRLVDSESHQTLTPDDLRVDCIGKEVSVITGSGPFPGVFHIRS